MNGGHRPDLQGVSRAGSSVLYDFDMGLEPLIESILETLQDLNGTFGFRHLLCRADISALLGFHNYFFRVFIIIFSNYGLKTCFPPGNHSTWLTEGDTDLACLPHTPA